MRKKIKANAKLGSTSQANRRREDDFKRVLLLSFFLFLNKRNYVRNLDVKNRRTSRKAAMKTWVTRLTGQSILETRYGHLSDSPAIVPCDTLRCTSPRCRTRDIKAKIKIEPLPSFSASYLPLLHTPIGYCIGILSIILVCMQGSNLTRFGFLPVK